MRQIRNFHWSITYTYTIKSKYISSVHCWPCLIVLINDKLFVRGLGVHRFSLINEIYFRRRPTYKKIVQSLKKKRMKSLIVWSLVFGNKKMGNEKSSTYQIQLYFEIRQSRVGFRGTEDSNWNDVTSKL